MDWKTGLTLSVSAFLAVIGYIATYLNNLRLAQRKDRLDRVDRQLRELYGPLLALVTASTTTWQAFVRAHVETDFLRGGLPVALENDENAALWRHWLTPNPPLFSQNPAASRSKPASASSLRYQ